MASAMRRGGTCGHEGGRSFHAVATYKEAYGGVASRIRSVRCTFLVLVWLSNRLAAWEVHPIAKDQKRGYLWGYFRAQASEYRFNTVR